MSVTGWALSHFRDAHVSITLCLCLRQVPRQRFHHMAPDKSPSSVCLPVPRGRRISAVIPTRAVCVRVGKTMTRLRFEDRNSLVDIGATSGRHHVCRAGMLQPCSRKEVKGGGGQRCSSRMTTVDGWWSTGSEDLQGTGDVQQ